MSNAGTIMPKPDQAPKAHEIPQRLNLTGSPETKMLEVRVQKGRTQHRESNTTGMPVVRGEGRSPHQSNLTTYSLSLRAALLKSMGFVPSPRYLLRFRRIPSKMPDFPKGPKSQNAEIQPPQDFRQNSRQSSDKAPTAKVKCRQWASEHERHQSGHA